MSYLTYFFFLFVSRGRAQAVEIVRNLCKLLKSLGQNEKAALEILVMEWVSSDAIDKSCIQVKFLMKLLCSRYMPA